MSWPSVLVLSASEEEEEELSSSQKGFEEELRSGEES
jgi:hypothetical protein